MIFFTSSLVDYGINNVLFGYNYGPVALDLCVCRCILMYELFMHSIIGFSDWVKAMVVSEDFSCSFVEFNS
jgi:hypothetical protein